MYGRSKKIGVLLVACFMMVQVMNVASSLALVARPQISASLTLGCFYDPTGLTFQLQLGSSIAVCVYEVALLVLALYSAFKNQASGIKFSRRSLNTLWGLLIRDNVLYFLLATLNWVISASSWIPSLPAKESVAYEMASSMLECYVYTMLGPVMMLSIRRFDAEQVQGGSSSAEEANTLEFAVVVSRS